MARTLVKPPAQPENLAAKRRLLELMPAVIGATVLMLGLLPSTSAGATVPTGSCAIQPEPSLTRNPDLGELEHVVETNAQEPHGREATPEDNVETEAERELGSQYGGEWYEVEAGDFAVGLAAGPISIQQATEKVHQVLARIIEPQYLAFAEAHIEVRSVPYTPAELNSTAESIRQELAAIGAGGASVGLTVREVPGSQSPEWPQVDVKFEGNTTQAECEAAIPILAKYGNEVTYSRREGLNSGGIGEPPPSNTLTLPAKTSVPPATDAPQSPPAKVTSVRLTRKSLSIGLNGAATVRVTLARRAISSHARSSHARWRTKTTVTLHARDPGTITYEFGRALPAGEYRLDLTISDRDGRATRMSVLRRVV